MKSKFFDFNKLSRQEKKTPVSKTRVKQYLAFSCKD